MRIALFIPLVACFLNLIGGAVVETTCSDSALKERLCSWLDTLGIVGAFVVIGLCLYFLVQ